MRVAVTGGSGFIGSHVVDALVDAGEDVLVIDHGRRPHRDDVEFANVSILDRASVRDATAGCEFIFHLAAISDVNHAYRDPIATLEANVLGTACMLEAAHRNAVRRFVLASTIWVYAGARTSGVLDEDEPLGVPDTRHTYVSSKISAEMLCHNYWTLYGVPYTTLRYGIPYGPRMRDALMLSRFITSVLGGEPITVMGDGSQHRAFLYVSDLAAAHLLVRSDTARNQTYNVSGRERITVGEAAELVGRLQGADLRVVYTAPREADYNGHDVSSDKLRRHLGWQPRVCFDEGLRRTIRWFEGLRREQGAAR